MLDKVQIDQQLAAMGESLKGDGFLFSLTDLRLPPEEQIPRVMVGEQAEGMIKNGHYFVTPIGPNPSSKANLRLAQIEKVKATNPDFEVPKSVTQQLAEAQAKIAELEAAKAQAPAGPPAPEKPAKNK